MILLDYDNMCAAYGRCFFFTVAGMAWGGCYICWEYNYQENDLCCNQLIVTTHAGYKYLLIPNGNIMIMFAHFKQLWKLSVMSIFNHRQYQLRIFAKVTDRQSKVNRKLKIFLWNEVSFMAWQKVLLTKVKKPDLIWSEVSSWYSLWGVNTHYGYMFFGSS